MPPTRSGPTPRRNSGNSGVSSRSKREEILRTATAYFGENGYEATKLADVAAAVGIGSTALYHYFESKLHCLYVIMADALEFFRSEFERETSAHDDYLDALLAVLAALVRPERAGRDAQPGARRRAGTGGGAPYVSSRGGGAHDGSRPDPRRRVRLGDVPRARHGAGNPARGRPAPTHSRAARAVQQHLALVPPPRLGQPGGGEGVLPSPPAGGARSSARAGGRRSVAAGRGGRERRLAFARDAGNPVAATRRPRTPPAAVAAG